jgi:hypothetical protein
MYECFECGSELKDGVCPHCAALSRTPESAGSVSNDENSPELKELLANTPILTDKDIKELAETNRWLNLPWWKRLFMKPHRISDGK